MTDPNRKQYKEAATVLFFSREKSDPFNVFLRGVGTSGGICFIWDGVCFLEGENRG